LHIFYSQTKKGTLRDSTHRISDPKCDYWMPMSILTVYLGR